MHVDVSELLNQDEGNSIDYAINGENPQLEDISLAGPISGRLHIARSKTGIALRGTLRATVRLECHRCLCSYGHQLSFSVQANYCPEPSPDEQSIDPRGSIDLSEIVRQDLIIHLPHKQLCHEDCAGITINKD